MTGPNILVGWMARNPLGIIAAFITLIYAMSALLLGTTVSKLSEGNQTVLVWFLVLFPVLILAVFGWLVINHHRKLYAPLDFRSDDGFLNAGSNLSPAAVGERLRAEVEDELAEPSADLSATGADQSSGHSNSASDLDANESRAPMFKRRRDETPLGSDTRGALIEQAYLAENLVLQELESEWRAPFRRNVRFPASTADRVLHADAVFTTDDGPIIVEVKFMSSSGDLGRRVRDARQQIQRFQTRFKGHPTMRFLIAIVISGDEGQHDDFVERFSSTATSSEFGEMLRFYSLEKLRVKYGI